MKKITVGVIGVAAIAAIFFYFNRPAKELCTIEPPLVTKTEDREQAGKLAADLEQLNTSADLEQKYTARAQAAYAQISETNTTLIILLKGAQCLGRDNPALAQSLVDTAVKLAKARNGLAGGGPDRTLSTTAEQLIQKGPEGEAILNTLTRTYGYKLASDR